MIFLTPELAKRLGVYFQTAAPFEISGLGEVVVKDRECLSVEKLFLFEQRVDEVKTKLSDAAMHKWLVEIIRSGGNPVNTRLWWHSHGYGSLFWSQEDEKTIRGFLADWMVSLLGNAQGEMIARLDIYKPIRITIHDLPIRIDYTLDPQSLAEIQKEVEQKMRRISHPRRKKPEVFIGTGKRIGSGSKGGRPRVQRDLTVDLGEMEFVE